MSRSEEPPFLRAPGSGRSSADRLRALEAKLTRSRSMASASRDGPLLASFGQEQLWLLEQIQPENLAYNQGSLYHLRGPLATHALERGLEEIARRHESLRTRLCPEGDRLCQTIRAAGDFVLPRTDLGGLEAAERLPAAERLAGGEIYRPFDLGRDSPLRPHLYRLSEDEHVLLLGTHHVGWDAWSLGVFWRELEALYRAERDGTSHTLPSLPIQYADFAAWQRQELAGDRLERLIGFWRSHLAAAPPLELPGDRQRPAQPTQSGESLDFVLSAELLQALKELGRARGTSLFTVLLSVFGAWLGRLSGQEDFVIGAPVAGRSRPEFEPLIGFFVNMLALRVDLREDPTFVELVERTKLTLLQALEHQDLPFEELVARLRLPRDPGRHPLFQVALVLHNMPPAEPRLVDLDVQLLPRRSARSRFDLTLTLVEKDSELRGTFEYATELFDRESIERWRGYFDTLLRSALAGPDQPLSRLSLSSAEERRKVVVEWNDTDREYPREARVHELFEATARRVPDSVALIEDERRMSYGELELQANRLARRLRALGVVSGTRVGVHLDRSVELVVAELAALKAGGAYVPLDRSYPLERLRFLLSDTRAEVVLTRGAWPEELRSLSVRVLDLAVERSARRASAAPDVDEEALASDEALESAGRAADTAYVMYTSGSTGLPKGVSVPHRGIVRLVRGQTYVPFDASARFLFHSSPSFDASTLEIWGPLLNGGTCVVFSERWPELGQLERVIREHGVTCLWLSAGLFNQIVGQRPSLLAEVRHVLTGGEALSVSHVQQALELVPGLRLINGYGPTESTTFTTTYAIERGTSWPGGTVPIGRPIGSTRCYVLDSRGEPTPIGVPGELTIGGDGVANGYFDRPELTLEKFVPDRFGPDPAARLYRTGDRCRWLADGNLEFLGRLDDQVKIRGYRVELGEIETQLLEHPAVAQAAVVARASVGGTKALAAFVVARTGQQPTVTSLRVHLAETLPDYMLPSFVEFVESLPLTPNGKVDRHALEAQGPARPREPGPVASPGSLEAKLLSIWRRVLGQESLGAQDDFFEHGGHSLLAMRMLYEIQEELGTRVVLGDLFATRTVEKLALRLGSAGDLRSTPFKGVASGVPLFYVPGPAGFGFLPRAVGERIGRARPYYDGLSYPPLLWRRPRLASVEEVASELVPQIRAICDGPCCLAGHSFGGVLAFEVARQLVALGQPVETLVLWDSVLRSERLGLGEAVRTVVRHLSTAGPRQRREFFTRRLDYYSKRAVRRLARALDFGRPPVAVDAHGNPTATDLNDLAHDVYVEATKLVEKYEPPPYAGRVVLFLAHARGERVLRARAALNGWKEVITGPLEVHPISAPHGEILSEPSGSLVAEATAAYLGTGS